MDNFLDLKNPKCTLFQDTFKKLRPQRHSCLDYNISQTDCRLEAGDTQIHLQQTDARYVPNPKQQQKLRKKVKYFSGVAPKWKFVDEIWLEKQEKQQKIYREQLTKRMIEKKRNEKKITAREHKKLLKKAGPMWYQELSPKQLRAVDNLKSCLKADVLENTVINTQDNIAILGLVPRPNNKKIVKALKNCCQCPVEFLLILYQLLKSQRVQYSINDRLLLSAVVHLTIRDTLKELHIRIPSPPSTPNVKKITVHKLKKVKYDSPYLEPYGFKRLPAKYCDVYYNKHIQKPTSDYFSYQNGTILDEIKHSSETITETKENNEIAQQQECAQRIYESLVKFRRVPTLLKPSVYKSCKNFRTAAEKKEVVTTEITNDQKTTTNTRNIKKVESNQEKNCKKQELTTATRTRKCNCRNKAQETQISINRKCQSVSKFAIKKSRQENKFQWNKEQKSANLPLCSCQKCLEDQNHHIVETFSTDAVPVLENSTPAACKCLKDHEAKEDFVKRKAMICALKQQKLRFIIGGVAITKSGPVYIISGVKQKSDCSGTAWKSVPQKHLPKEPTDSIGYNPTEVKQTLKENIFNLNTPNCKCMEVLEQFEREHFDCMELLEQYLRQMKEDINQYQDDMLQQSKRSSLVKECFALLQEVPKNNWKPLSTDNSDKVRLEEVLQNDSTTETKILSLATIEAPNVLYIIGGVVNSRTGPVYIISGVRNFDLHLSLSNVIEDTVSTLKPTISTSNITEKNQRFFIFDKLSSGKKLQKKILKKALESMAIDDYPLAKLPQCYKLPHFKLWMQMRCQKFWTNKHRYDYVTQSKNMWRHTYHFNVGKLQVPQIGISKARGKMLTWAQASYVKHLIHTFLEKFYIEVKEKNINQERRFFPTTFSYEFPFSSWRNCYFAYTSSRIEDVLAKNMWQKYDYKPFSEMSRYCSF